MKSIFIAIFFMCSNIMFAQNTNQFDAQGSRHGIWKKYYDNTKVLRYEGEFSHGKEIGEFKFYKNHNGTAILYAIRKYATNTSKALVTFYNEKKMIVSQGYMEGKAHIGEWIYYHNGSQTRMMVEHYNTEGKLEGVVQVFYKNGQLAEERSYISGLQEGISKWYSEDNVLLKTYTYKNGILHGEAKFYDVSGQLILEGQYKNDKKNGVWTHYSKGEITKQKDYTKRSKNPYKK